MRYENGSLYGLEVLLCIAISDYDCADNWTRACWVARPVYGLVVGVEHGRASAVEVHCLLAAQRMHQLRQFSHHHPFGFFISAVDSN